MKYISEWKKRQHARHALKSFARKLSSRRRAKMHRRMQLAVFLNIDIDNHPGFSNRGGNRAVQIRIIIPEVLSFSECHNETMRFFRHLRSVALKKQNRIFFDFRSLRVICPSSALVLAAEIDRWRRLRGIRPRIKQLRQMDKNISRLLNEMGLFDVVEATNPPAKQNDDKADIIFIPFRSENKTMGERASEIAKDLEKITGKKLQGRSFLYRGLSEAMTNVANHAYPEGEAIEFPVVKGQWWMFASFQKSTQRLTVTFYDQGVGIPRTLPRVHTVEVVLGILRQLGLIDDDASRIKASTIVGHSQTRQAHRGKGLKDMKRFTHMVQDGFLRILSGRGEYVYYTNGSDECFAHQHDIGGTLIQWTARI